jgi:hypothetical protein
VKEKGVRGKILFPPIIYKMSVFNYNKGNDKQKTCFNLYLTNTNLSTFIKNNPLNGDAFNITFTVNLRGVIDSADFSKRYKVYVNYEVVAGFFGSANYARYTIGGNRLSNVTPTGETSGDVLLYEDYFYTSTRRTTIKWNDNAPLYVNSLYNVDFVKIEVLFGNNTQQFGGQGRRFAVILRFEEI